MHFVKKHFQYSDTNKLNGILHYIYTKHSISEYFQLVIADSSSYTPGSFPVCAIDFSDNSYWYAGNKIAGEYLTIHFPYHIIDIEGYEIKTSSYQVGCFPRIWSFSASTNPIIFTNADTINDIYNQMGYSFASMYVPFKKGKYDYFRITSYQSYLDDPRIDINQIELYGTLYTKMKPTHKQKPKLLFHNFLYIICCQKRIY